MSVREHEDVSVAILMPRPQTAPEYEPPELTPLVREREPVSRTRRIVVGAEVALIGLLLLAIAGFLPVLTFSAKPVLAAAPSQTSPVRGDNPAGMPPGFAGRTGLPAHVNAGALDSYRACGQAAAASVIETWQPWRRHGDSDPGTVQHLERAYGHDVEFGIFGTSPALMQQMLKGEGLSASWGDGETSLRAWVGSGYPAIVLQDVGPSWHTVGLHWTMVWGYDDNYVYLSNWSGDDGHDRVSWSVFRQGWTDGVLMRGSGVAGKFLLAKTA